MFRKNKLAMLVSEFLGTAVLALAVLALSHSQLSYPYFIASAAGLTLVLLA
jgi:glycerol uptake facilitator-like aquaporin